MDNEFEQPPDDEDRQARTRSFVVRLWLEEKRDGRSLWRGHITHVASHERRHIRRLDDIPLFIVPYLEQLGGHIGWFWRVRRWLK